MEPTKVTASEFQQAFGSLSDKARHEPVIITKHGRDFSSSWRRKSGSVSSGATGVWVSSPNCPRNGSRLSAARRFRKNSAISTPSSSDRLWRFLNPSPV